MTPKTSAQASSSVVSDRKHFSEARITDLASRISEHTSSLDLGRMFIFAAGSYARGEASEFSDIDLFFGYENNLGSELPQRRTNELRLFGHVIEAVDDLGFPQLSADCKYLRTHLLTDVLKEMGGDRDDVDNHFTFRMLLLLEGRCIYGHEHYSAAVSRVVESYYRDYPKHVNEFQPWFLLNDIVRYWKTLTLNYEHRRRPSESAEDEDSRRVRNFKLKYSRMTTCFATLAAIGAQMKYVTPDVIEALVLLTPSERFESALQHMPSIELELDRLKAEYAWFLDLTGLSTDSLHAKFGSHEDRMEMFQRADRYGSLMYDLLRAIDAQLRKEGIEFLRLLVI
jgi:predicted nucleotidyltransferase